MDSFNTTDSSILSTESGSEGSEFDEYCSSQSDYSLPSESNCFSYHADEPSNTNVSLAKSKKSANLLQKLYFRETRGNFSSHPRAPNLRLFNSVPAENKICLQQVLPESAFHTNHVFLGLSKCGQFLLSYTHSIELDVIIFNNVHKYRLHWWSFVPHQRARKVAEVMLFGNQGVYCDLHISVCQWPIDTTKLLVYGYCVHTDHCQFGHSHLTITTVPSLNTCRDCLKVAASYEEEDLAAIWDSCVRFSCLKHGLTIHSNFDVVSPYPKFDPRVSMKRDGVVFFNTGNFLHVLRADLESFGSNRCGEATGRTNPADAAQQQCPPHHHPAASAAFTNLEGESDRPRVDNAVNNFLGEFLEENSDSAPPATNPETPCRNGDKIDRLRQEIEEGKAEGAKLAEELDGESRRFWSALEEMRNSLRNPDAPSSPSERVENAHAIDRLMEEAESLCNHVAEKREAKAALTQRERAVRDFQNEVFCRNNKRVATSTSKSKHVLDTSRDDPEAENERQKRARTDADAEEEGGRPVPREFTPLTVGAQKTAGVSVAEGAYRRDKSDEVCAMGAMLDAATELSIACGGDERGVRSATARPSLLMVSTAAVVIERPDCRKEASNESAQKKCRKPPRGGVVKIGSPQPPLTPPKVAAAETVYEFTDDQPDNSEKLSSYRRRRLAEKKYEFCEEEGEDAENIVPFRLLRRAAPQPAPADQPGTEAAVLRPLNRNLVATAITLLSPRDPADWPKPGVRKVPVIDASGDGCLADLSAHQKGGRDDAQPYARATKCTIQFKRRYIEVDDELVSTTTDIEDDDCTGSAPYHFALPLEIHGAGYVQLQMISNSKADKLMGAPGVVVHQMSFDVEAFCHEMAQRLCEAAGKKYCFCVDYDVEIIDVCIITGDVLVLAIMRIEAIIVSKGLAKSLRRGEILLGGQRNQYQGGCTFVWNTDTGAHRIVATSPLCESSAPDDSQEPWGPAKSHVQTLRKTLPQVPMCHAVRSISNRPVFAEESYKCLSDLDNLIDLVL